MVMVFFFKAESFQTKRHAIACVWQAIIGREGCKIR